MELHGIQIDDEVIGRFWLDNGITRLPLFGSILTDRFGPESDVGLVVDFDPDRRVSLFGVGGITADLMDVLGRDVDLRTPEDLSPSFRDHAVSIARPLYVA